MKLGADVIEAGFPASSRGEFKATQRIGQLGGSSVIAALCRARREDIDMAWEALRGRRTTAAAHIHRYERSPYPYKASQYA